MSLQSVVTTLPIRPRINPNIGFYAIPVILDIIARVQNHKLVIPINCMGFETIDSFTIHQYSETLRGLLVSCCLPHDSSVLSFAKQAIDIGLEQGWILKEIRIIKSCSCGRLEYLFTGDNQFFSKKTLSSLDSHNQEICSVCQRNTTEKPQPVLLICIPKKTPEIVSSSFIQTFGERELCSSLDFFAGRQLLLSRSVSRGFDVDIEGVSFTIDIDFLYMVYLAFLQQERGYSISTFAVGMKMAKQLALSLIVTSLLGYRVPESIVFIPYFSLIKERNSLDISRAQFSQDYNLQTLRVLLSLGFGANRKEVNVESSLIHTLHSILRKPLSIKIPEINTQDVGSTWVNTSASSLVRVISSLRKPSVRINSQEEHLLYHVLGLS